MFPWSDNWWLEGNKAWFCGGDICALFCVNMENGQCELVARIPECDFFDFRLYSFCMKYKNTIFCLPSIEKFIWSYDIKKKVWEKIAVDNKEQVFYYQKNNDQIFFWDYEGWLYKMDLNEKKVRKIYYLAFQNGEMTQYVIVDNKLYHVRDNKIICIDLYSDDIHTVTYDIPHIKAGLFAICYDGTNFWLSGHAKEICVWNPELGLIKIITDFPKQFGFYHFRKGEIPYLDCESLVDMETAFFEISISLGKYVWFIPGRSSDIIYIDKETYDVFILEIEEERETKESIDNHLMDFKFLFQYIREDRYIGVYSLKNRYIFEIDTVELCIKKRNYELSGQAIISMMKEIGSYHGETIFMENRENDKILFSAMLKVDNEKNKKRSHNIGGSIYHTLI